MQNGYYELNNICINCPNIEDNSLDQCYHYCKDNIKQWYSINCNECDIGYELINNQCIPICGDLLIKGNEQCDDNNILCIMDAIIVNINVHYIVKLVIKIQFYLVKIFVVMDIQLEMKNVKIVMIFNIIDVINVLQMACTNLQDVFVINAIQDGI